MNRVEIIGGAVRDPSMVIGDHGAAITNVSLAVSGARYDFESKQQIVTTVYVSVVFFGTIAEKVAAQVAQGDEVWVVGELDQTVIEKDGKSDRKTKVNGRVFAVTRHRQGPSSTERKARESGAPTPEEPF